MSIKKAPKISTSSKFKQTHLLPLYIKRQKQNVKRSHFVRTIHPFSAIPIPTQKEFWEFIIVTHFEQKEKKKKN